MKKESQEGERNSMPRNRDLHHEWEKDKDSSFKMKRTHIRGRIRSIKNTRQSHEEDEGEEDILIHLHCYLSLPLEMRPLRDEETASSRVLCMLDIRFLNIMSDSSPDSRQDRFFLWNLRWIIFFPSWLHSVTKRLTENDWRSYCFNSDVDEEDDDDHYDSRGRRELK